MIGWCCEHPLAFYFGFPFSFLLAIAGYQYDVIAPYQNDDFLKILFTSQPQVGWRFLPYQFFLDLLFWFNIVLILSRFARPSFPKISISSWQRLLALFCHDFSTYRWYDFTGGLPCEYDICRFHL